MTGRYPYKLRPLLHPTATPPDTPPKQKPAAIMQRGDASLSLTIFYAIDRLRVLELWMSVCMYVRVCVCVCVVTMS